MLPWTQFHVHIRRVPISELPTDEEGLAKWCRDTYELKVMKNLTTTVDFILHFLTLFNFTFHRTIFWINSRRIILLMRASTFL